MTARNGFRTASKQPERSKQFLNMFFTISEQSISTVRALVGADKPPCIQATVRSCTSGVRAASGRVDGLGSGFNREPVPSLKSGESIR